MKIPSSAETGTRLEQYARTIAPVLVAVYTAGYILGQWVHRVNDRMAAAYVRLLGLAPAPQPQPQPVIRAQVIRQPLTVEALIASHTQRQLMAMAGTKSKRSKKHLAELILKIK